MQHNFYSGWVANYWQINYSASIFVLALENYMTDKKITSQFDAGFRENDISIPQFSSSNGRDFEAAAKFGKTAARVLGGLNGPQAEDLSSSQSASIVYAAENMSEDERKMSTVAFATRILGGNELLTSNGDWNYGALDPLIPLTANPDNTQEEKLTQQRASLYEKEKKASTPQEAAEIRKQTMQLTIEIQKIRKSNREFATETYDLIAGIDGDKKSMTAVELSTAITIADENRDGKITYKERKAFVENMRLLNKKEKDQPQVDA